MNNSNLCVFFKMYHMSFYRDFEVTDDSTCREKKHVYEKT